MKKEVAYYTACHLVKATGSAQHFGTVRSAIVKVTSTTDSEGGVTEAVEHSIRMTDKVSLARAELEIAIVCAASAPNNSTIVSFSEYVVKGANEWMEGWAKNNWRNKRGDEVKNRDLWQQLLKISSDRKLNWFLDSKASSLDRYSESAIELAQTGMVTEVIELKDEEEEPSFVVNEIAPEQRAIPVAYGGW